MKRSKTIFLLFVAAGVLSSCGEKTRPNGLRTRTNAQGQVERDAQGNPVYEDDEGQHYSHSGGYFYPMFTRMNGFSTIPGSGIAAPGSAAPVTSRDITSRSVPVTRGGFGSAGTTRSGGGGFVSSGG